MERSFREYCLNMQQLVFLTAARKIASLRSQ